MRKILRGVFRLLRRVLGKLRIVLIKLGVIYLARLGGKIEWLVQSQAIF